MLIRERKTFNIAAWEGVQLGKNSDWICGTCWQQKTYRKHPCEMHPNSKAIPEYTIEKSPHFRGQYERKLLMNTVLFELARPFPVEDIQFRVGSTNKDKTKGMALAYIDARAVMDRLDEVCGLYWSDTYNDFSGKAKMCTIAIKVGDEWITRSDGADDTNFEATKGGFSDAFKRAAVKFGIGRYLYDMPVLWMDLKNEKYFSNEDDVRKQYTPYLLASMFPGEKLTLAQQKSLMVKIAPNKEEFITRVFGVSLSFITNIAAHNLVWLSNGIAKGGNYDELSKECIDATKSGRRIE